MAVIPTENFLCMLFLFWGIIIILDNKLQQSGKEGFHSADFGAVEGKLLCSKFILEVGSHFYGEFPLQKNIILGHYNHS
jgi:hypothetical protein